MPAPIERMSLRELPAEFEELDAYFDQLDGWEPLPKDATDEQKAVDATEYAALERYVQERLAILEPTFTARARDAHGWLLRQKDDEAATAAEKKRVTKLADIAKRKHARLKDWVKGCMERCGLAKVGEATWRLRTQANGGVRPLTHDDRIPVPLQFAAPYALDPQTLVENVRGLLSKDVRFTDEQLFDMLGLDPQRFEPHNAKARAYLETTGEVPDGWTLGERGTQLRVE